MTFNGWFPLNFSFDYLNFLEQFYGESREKKSENNGALLDFANKYGDKVEKEIAVLSHKIIDDYNKK